MDFFQRQDQARRKTKWLVAYFFLCVATTIVAVYFAVAFIYASQVGKNVNRSSKVSLWHPELFFYVCTGTFVVVALGSLVKMKQLAGGGGTVAVSLGGRLLNPQTHDVNELKLRNVVEEMAIASGVPVPEIYILEEERGINAFAAGNSISDAAVGVTRGAIEQLSRDELQGVIAHEFSHILNGDMRLNLRLIGWIAGILGLTIIGRILLRTASTRRSSSSQKKGGNPLPILGAFLLVIGFIGVFFARLIKAAVSRQREFLADAAAVQFTRNPHGLAGALKKIGGLTIGSRLESPNAEEASHMFFGNGLRESWFNMLATHPPLVERIRLLEPAFDGTFPKVVAPSRAPELKPAPPLIPPPRYVPPPQLSDLIGGGSPTRAVNALANMGTPGAAHLHFGAGVIHSLPPVLSRAVHEPFGAAALIYGMLLSSDDQARRLQLSHLQERGRQPAFHEASRLFPELQRLGQNVKLPLVEMSMPALRQLSRSQYHEFSQNVTLLAGADSQIDLFEYALQKIILRHLHSHFEPAPKPIIQYYSLLGLTADCAVLLSALALSGHDDVGEIAGSFSLGARALNLPKSDLHLMELNECSLERIDAALNRLAQSAPQCKKQLLEACAQTVSADGVIQSGEAELLRAIADALDCPLPPLLG